MDLISLLNWRYATKRMSGRKIPQEKLDNILEAIRLSASSVGLQPYNILVIEDQQLREKIKPIAYNQAQITEASHLLVFAAWDKVTQKRADDFINNIAVTRNTTPEALVTMVAYTDNFIAQSAEENFSWAARQTYIALGTALLAAASEQVDATPMEGFDPAALDNLLNLEERGLKSVAILPLGYRDNENDWLAKLPKVRTPKSKLFIDLTADQLMPAN